MTSPTVDLIAVTEADFEDFKALRKNVMREHVDNQGLPWIETEEDAYHRELFDKKGLRKITIKGKRIGYVGVLEDEHGAVEISRFCITKEYQSKGIGSQVLELILFAPAHKGKKFFLYVLRMNRAQRLCERFGFIRTHDDGKLAYYERPADTPKPIASPPFQTHSP